MIKCFKFYMVCTIDKRAKLSGLNKTRIVPLVKS